MEKWGGPKDLWIRRLVLSTTNDMLVIFVLWGVSAASMLTVMKVMWAQQTPEFGYFSVPNSLINRCFKLTTSTKYSHFPISQHPSQWSRNSQHFRENNFYNRPPLNFSLCHINPIRHMRSYFFNILTISSLIRPSLTVLVPSDFLTKSLYAFLFSPTGLRVTNPKHFIVLDLTTRRWEKVIKLVIAKISPFSYSSLLGSIIFFGALLSHIFRLNCFLSAKEQF